MLRNVALLWMSVGRKTIIGIAGLALSGFVFVHLLGNLTLFSSDPMSLNKYAHKLESLGPILIVAEMILLLIFVAHFVLAITVILDNKKARPVGYAKNSSAGGPSKKNIFSQTMIYTGLGLLVFVAWHLFHFKFGPGISEGYVITVHGEQYRDLHRLVVEEFSKPLIVMLYVVVMLFLGFHLRHGFWSAFQSIGANNSKYSSIIYSTGILFAVVMAVGFLVLPIWLFFMAGAQ
jgi:succinate dehydrogenase / fumarate reductase, cytochrome b subunit